LSQAAPMCEWSKRLTTCYRLARSGLGSWWETARVCRERLGKGGQVNLPTMRDASYPRRERRAKRSASRLAKKSFATLRPYARDKCWRGGPGGSRRVEWLPLCGGATVRRWVHPFHRQRRCWVKSIKRVSLALLAGLLSALLVARWVSQAAPASAPFFDPPGIPTSRLT
jgi:hypothetical protein